jgi:hypothetical protein
MSFDNVILSIFLILSLSAAVGHCSRGDRDYTFHNCMKKCKEQQCDGNGIKVLIK